MTSNVINSGGQVRFGILADLQYFDGPPFKNRHFRASIDKLRRAITQFNSMELDFVINLGDTIDRDFNSFNKILPEFSALNAKLYHVLGNHDFEVEEERYKEVSKVFNILEYYSFSVADWRFIVLDGNDISTFANAEGSGEYELAESWLREMEREGKINAQIYNGGIGEDQLNWLESELYEAREEGQQVIVFCHYPVFPDNKHNLLNADALLELILSYDVVKAWFCGHNHKGNYGQIGNIHFINMKGMVEGEKELVFATATLRGQEISITGFGSEISARLSIKSRNTGAPAKSFY